MQARDENRPPEIDVETVWGISMAAVHCPHCGEAHLVPQDDVPQRCPFCLRESIEIQPAYLREEPPEQIVPAEISSTHLQTILENWAQGIWFRPPGMQGGELMQRARRYLIPLWLVDGQVDANWRADVGFNYQVVSYQDRYQDGVGWQSHEIEETRVRWEPRAGRLDRRYENVAAPALEDHRQLMGRLGAYDLTRRTPYDPDAVENAAVRIPTLEPAAAWPGAEAAFVRAAQTECRQAASADHIRDFVMQAQYDNVNWSLLLLPAYVTWYQEGERIWPVLVNGQSGRVSGVRRASARRATTASLIMGAVALALFLLGGLLTVIGLALLPLILVGGLILIIGVILALAAPAPVIGAWMFNRNYSGQSLAQ